MVERTLECVVHQVLHQVIYLSIIVQFPFQMFYEIQGNLESTLVIFISRKLDL